jgi:transglutaminase-like putative cysteine protease
MQFDRRIFLQSSAAFLAGLPGLANAASAPTDFAPSPGAWRNFKVVTSVQIQNPPGKAQAWIPLPSVNQAAWIKSNGSQWTTNGSAVVWRDPVYGAEILHVKWAKNEPVRTIEITSLVAMQDRKVNPAAQTIGLTDLTPADRSFYTAGTDFIPVDGIVKETSDKIVSRRQTEIEKVQAIYDWMVENTYRDARVRGCGSGDIVALLKSGNFGGKCADLNALFVGLVRAAGIPARDIYGVRVAPSRFGYKSLGANSNVVTKAQHCRAEVFFTNCGWTATDPADVRKVMLEEPPGHLTLDNPKVAAARRVLLGAWEGNWLAYNMAHDIALPGSTGPKIAFLMYPQAEIDGRRLDSLDATTFKYSITASAG